MLDNRKQDLINYIETNKNKIYRIAYSYMKNEDLALDTVQDTVEKAIRKIYSLHEEKYMQTWFYRILINQCLTNLKRNKIRQTINIDDYIVESIDNIDESIAIYECIDSLNPKLKSVIILRFFEDMKIEDIAHITNSNINTVKSRLYKGLQELKSKMEESL